MGILDCIGMAGAFISGIAVLVIATIDFIRGKWRW